MRGVKSSRNLPRNRLTQRVPGVSALFITPTSINSDILQFADKRDTIPATPFSNESKRPINVRTVGV